MAWWSRVKRRKLPAGPQDCNVLVISDIHLGEDILVDGPEVLHTYIRTLNGTLMGFLSAHASQREDGLPWHLVINGDMFDFVKMPLEASSGLTLRAGSEQEALRKLERILRMHRPLFAALARFMVAGHRITIVEGNHDGEFYFDGVRGALRQELLRLAALDLRRRGLPAIAAQELGDKLAFSSWFVAQMGHYHIEHGHQYDPFCAFEHKLAPLEAQVDVLAEATLMQPMSHRLLPRVAELMGNFSTHGITELSLKEIAAMLAQLGVKRSLQLMCCYGQLCWQLLRESGPGRRRTLAQMATHQANRLRLLGAQTCYSVGVLRALDTLHARPAEYSLADMLHLFWVDRLAIMATASLAALAWGIFGASALQMASLWVLGLLCAVAMSHLPAQSVSLRLREAAARIAQVTGARYVIFGHSHVPECIDLHDAFGVGHASAPSHYLNSGSWVTREILRGDEGRGMTYVKIAAAGAQLWRWRGVDRPPVHLAHAAAGPVPGPGPGAECGPLQGASHGQVAI